MPDPRGSGEHEARHFISVYLGNYAKVEGDSALASLVRYGSPTANSRNYTYPYAGTAAQQIAYMDQLSGGTFSGTLSAYLGRTSSANEESFNTALIATQQYWNTSSNTDALPSNQQMQQINALLDALRNSALAGTVYTVGTAVGADPQAVANATQVASAFSDVVMSAVVPRASISPVLGQTTVNGVNVATPNLRVYDLTSISDAALNVNALRPTIDGLVKSSHLEGYTVSAASVTVAGKTQYFLSVSGQAWKGNSPNTVTIDGTTYTVVLDNSGGLGSVLSNGQTNTVHAENGLGSYISNMFSGQQATINISVQNNSNSSPGMCAGCSITMPNLAENNPGFTVNIYQGSTNTTP
ncbi:MAG: hypothetical protein EON54_04950 [Alcaligenaceae bacterium]|nr:MAG: hypothetical protein EON54_04950 [Alcaligenaceae bacterium]